MEAARERGDDGVARRAKIPRWPKHAALDRRRLGQAGGPRPTRGGVPCQGNNQQDEPEAVQGSGARARDVRARVRGSGNRGFLPLSFGTRRRRLHAGQVRARPESRSHTGQDVRSEDEEDVPQGGAGGEASGEGEGCEDAAGARESRAGYVGG